MYHSVIKRISPHGRQYDHLRTLSTTVMDASKFVDWYPCESSLVRNKEVPWGTNDYHELTVQAVPPDLKCLDSVE